MFFLIAYILSVVSLNFVFGNFPEYAYLWAGMVGIVFVLRDLVQTKFGHWTLLAMALALVISYFTSSAQVAIASATAFAISELVDWIVFTVTKKSLKDRIFISSIISIPVDSFVFLSMMGLLSPGLFVMSLFGKSYGVFLVWLWMHWRERKAR